MAASGCQDEAVAAPMVSLCQPEPQRQIIKGESEIVLHHTAGDKEKFLNTGLETMPVLEELAATMTSETFRMGKVIKQTENAAE